MSVANGCTGLNITFVTTTTTMTTTMTTTTTATTTTKNRPVMCAHSPVSMMNGRV